VFHRWCSFGEWAVVTGASSGIGRCAADHIASCGVNVVLVAKEAEYLNIQSRAFRKKHPRVAFRSLAIDLDGPVEQYNKINQGEQDHSFHRSAPMPA
jgi:short-subunit dehydrogenase